MRKSGDYYVVEVRCSKENAVELVEWLGKNGQQLDRVESTLSNEQLTLSELAKKMSEHSGTNGFLMEINFKDEETALLARMKFGN